MDACLAFNRGELSDDALVGTTAQLGFVNVIDAFHVDGSGPVPVRFFEDRSEGSRGGVGPIRLTGNLRRSVGSMQGRPLLAGKDHLIRVSSLKALEAHRFGHTFQ